VAGGRRPLDPGQTGAFAYVTRGSKVRATARLRLLDGVYAWVSGSPPTERAAREACEQAATDRLGGAPGSADLRPHDRVGLAARQFIDQCRVEQSWPRPPRRAETVDSYEKSYKNWVHPWPGNLRLRGLSTASVRRCSIDDLKMADVELVVMVDGIPLYGVPRTSTAEALVRAGGASERREILGRRWKTISADCRLAVEGCTSDAVAPYAPFVTAALDALDAGHTASAQALSGSLVDAILTGYFGKDRYKYTPDKKGTRTKDAHDEFSIRQFVAFAPIWQAYQKFFVDEGDKVPATFSRNATAHTVSRRQFNRRNAVQGLMLVCSFLYRLDEEATGRASGA
jgi:hypothetical protein